MDMWGVLPVEGRRFQVAVKDMKQLGREPLRLGMASCHSLTLINGALSGDPLDVKVRSQLHDTGIVCHRGSDFHAQNRAIRRV
jgi:hypothetical protein